MRVLVLEFNELCPSLLDRLITAGQLPNFARLRDSSVCAVTDAEEEPPYLEPWIQWVTAHTGLTFAEHKCFNLNEGGGLKEPRIWDMVSRAGGTNWICGSMNAAIETSSFRGHFLPDPWSTEATPYPAQFFEPFSHLVKAYVQEHSARPDLGAPDYLRFAGFMIANGLSPATVWATVRQLISEQSANTKWRRAMILDRLQWDLFKSIYAKARPDFSTFFLNSTAHFQHFHWREMEPSLFSVHTSPADMETFSQAIPDGYRNMDWVVGQALDLVGNDGCVVLLTALSQQPMLIHEDKGGRQIHRHRDIDDLLSFAGVEKGWRYAPVMSQQFLLHFASEDAAAAAAELIEGLRLADGRQPMWARRDGAQLDCGCMIDQSPGEDMLVLSSRSNEARRFFDLFYPLEALRSGMHHPDGVFWIKAPGLKPAILPDKVSLCQVAPTLAALAEVGFDEGREAAGISLQFDRAA